MGRVSRRMTSRGRCQGGGGARVNGPGAIRRTCRGRGGGWARARSETSVDAEGRERNIPFRRLKARSDDAAVPSRSDGYNDETTSAAAQRPPYSTGVAMMPRPSTESHLRRHVSLPRLPHMTECDLMSDCPVPPRSFNYAKLYYGRGQRTACPASVEGRHSQHRQHTSGDRDFGVPRFGQKSAQPRCSLVNLLS
jgi:hypothetical protein